MPITLITADDQQMLLTSYKLLAKELDMVVLEECKSPQEAIIAFSRHKPQVLLLDIRFDDEKSGFDVAREVLKSHTDANIVFISQYDQASYINEAFQIGAKAFLTKNCDAETFKAAILAASKGDKFLMPELENKVVQFVVNGDINPRSVLQNRQFQIFMLIANGATNQEVSEKLNIHMKTVSLNRQEIQDKLKISRPQEFTKLAITYRLIEV